MLEDLDPAETREWMDALDSVMAFEGADRAFFLLDEVIEEARRKGAPVPYSASTVFTEYWDLHTEANGDQYLVDTNTVEDSMYLQAPWVTAIHFKKEPDGAKWDPSPCDARF